MIVYCDAECKYRQENGTCGHRTPYGFEAVWLESSVFSDAACSDFEERESCGEPSPGDKANA